VSASIAHAAEPSAEPADRAVWQPFETTGLRFERVTETRENASPVADSLRALLPTRPGVQREITLNRQYLFHGNAPSGSELPEAWAGRTHDGAEVRLLRHRGAIELSVLESREISRLTADEDGFAFEAETPAPIQCDHPIEAPLAFAEAEPFSKAVFIPDRRLRQFILLASATGEFTRSAGGTVDAAFARIAQRVNEANAILEQELAITLQLSTGSLTYIYTDPNTDPFSDGNTDALIDQNAALLGGNGASFDVGHNFHGGGGGRAYLSHVCDRYRAGATSSNSLKTFLHELGHQFGAKHTFTGTAGNCGANRGDLVEPGSGSTIMSYAGTCAGENLQNSADLYFHQHSLKQMEYRAHRVCGVDISEGRSLPAVFTRFPGAYVVPRDTPLLLVGAAVDREAEAGLVFGWEQTFGPVAIRSFPPRDDAFVRAIPSLSVIDSGTGVLGSRYLVSGSQATLSLAARSVGFVQGTWAAAPISVTVDSVSGPFRVTAPTGHLSVTAGSRIDLQWDVASTNLPPVSCGQVDVLLGLDSGVSALIPLARSIPNSGSAAVGMPDVPVQSGRLWVACSSSPFASPAPALVSSSAPGNSAPVYIDVLPSELQICAGESVEVALWTRSPAAGDVTFSAESVVQVEFPNGTSASPNSIASAMLSAIAVEPGRHTVLVRASNGLSGAESTATVDVLDVLAQPSIVAPESGSAHVTAIAVDIELPDRADRYQVQVSSSPTFDDSEVGHWTTAPEGEPSVSSVIYYGVQELGANIYARAVAIDDACNEISYSNPARFCYGSPAVPPVIFPTLQTGDEITPLPSLYLVPDSDAGGSYADAMTIEISGDDTFSNARTFSGDYIVPDLPLLASLRLTPGQDVFYRTRSRSECAENVGETKRLTVSPGFCIADPQRLVFDESGQASIDVLVDRAGEVNEYAVAVALSGSEDYAEIGIEMFKVAPEGDRHVATLRYPGHASCPTEERGRFWISSERSSEGTETCGDPTLSEAPIFGIQSRASWESQGANGVWRFTFLDPTWAAGRSVTVDELCFFPAIEELPPEVFQNGFE